MAFWIGSAADLQSRRAVGSAFTSEQSSSVLPQLLGKDTLPDGVGGEVQRDWPNPSFAVLHRQAQRAIASAFMSEQSGVLPQLLGKDTFYDGPGQAPNFDEPNPSFALVDWQARLAARATDGTQFDTPLPAHVGPLQQFPNGADVYDLPPRAAARATADVYGIAATFPQVLIGQDQFNAGKQSFELPPKAPPRARDYSFTASFPLELVGKDQFNAGAQLSGNTPATAARASTLSEPGVNLTIELTAAAPTIPPGAAALDQQYRTTPRAREYGQTAGFFHGLDGQDALNAGAQLSGNTPAGPRRATDYTFVASFPPELIGQDAMAAGRQSFDLPPRAASRAADYTFTASFPLELIGKDAVNPGAQLSGNAPAGALRASTLGEPGTNPIPLLTSVVSPFVQTTAPTELSPRGPSRARDYSFSASYFAGLIGKDQFNPGAQLSGNVPATAPRASTLSEPGVNQTILLTAAPPVIPQGQSTALTVLAPSGPQRAREYGQTSAFFHGLDGQDTLPNGAAGQVQRDWPNPSFAILVAQSRTARTAADVGQFDTPLPVFVGLDSFPNGVGGQVQDEWPLPTPAPRRSFAVYDPGTNSTVLAPIIVQVPVGASTAASELPAKATARLNDYSFTATFFHGLDGKDALPTGHSTANTELPPKAAARARDYTWLQTLPLYVYQQLPPGASTESSVVPPRGPARSRDYTFLRSLPVHLIGQDTLYGAPGEVPAYDWQLPPRAAPRLRDYSHSATASYGSGIPPRDLFYTLSAPFASWIMGAIPPHSRWQAGTPSVHVVTGAPRQ